MIDRLNDVVAKKSKHRCLLNFFSFFFLIVFYYPNRLKHNTQLKSLSYQKQREIVYVVVVHTPTRKIEYNLPYLSTSFLFILFDRILSYSTNSVNHIYIFMNIVICILVNIFFISKVI